MNSPWHRHIVLVSERNENALASLTRSVVVAPAVSGLMALSVIARMRAPRDLAIRAHARVSRP